MNQAQYKKWVYLLGEWLLAAGFLYCTLYLYLADFPKWHLERYTAFMTGFLVLLAMLCIYGGRFRKWFFLIYGLLFVGYGFVGMRRLAIGFCRFINPWLREFCHYYEIQPVQLTVHVPKVMRYMLDGEFIRNFLVFILLFMTPAVVRMVYSGKGRLGFILAGAWPLALKLFTGKVPETAGFFLWMILFVVLLWTSRKGEDRREHEERIKTVYFLTGAFWLVLFAAGKLMTPELYEEKIDFTKPKAEILAAGADLLEDMPSVFPFGGKSASIGLSLGNLSEPGNLSYTGETMLTLNYPKEDRMLEPLFLRGYIGEIYTGDRWKQSEIGRGSEAYEALKKELLEKGIYIDSPEIAPLSWFSAESRNIQITNVKAKRGSVYVPYWSMSPVELSKEGYVTLAGRKAEKKYEISVVRDSEEAWEITQVVPYIDDSEAKEYADGAAGYMELVGDIYLQLPQKSRLADMVKKEKSKVLGKLEFTLTPIFKTEAAAEYVKETLAWQAEYSLSPGKLPEGEDFIDYFFFENKKGYCMHFATAATIMFRALGIPARYVEGYVVNGDMIRASENPLSMGEPVEINVPDKNAHAWVEVYDENAGWIPVEVTPGYTSNGNFGGVREMPEELDNPSEPENTETEEPAETLSPEESEIPKVSEKPEESKGPEVPEVETETPTEMENAGKTVFPVLAVLAVSVFLIWLRRAVILYRRRKELSKASEADKIRIYYRELLKFLEGKGLGYNGEPVSEWSPRVAEGLKEQELLDAELWEGFEEFAALAFKAAFGKEISREEERKAREYYRRFRRKIYQSASWKNKVLYKYLKIFEEL